MIQDCDNWRLIKKEDLTKNDSIVWFYSQFYSLMCKYLIYDLVKTTFFSRLVWLMSVLRLSWERQWTGTRSKFSQTPCGTSFRYFCWYTARNRCTWLLLMYVSSVSCTQGLLVLFSIWVQILVFWTTEVLLYKVNFLSTSNSVYLNLNGIFRLRIISN